MPSGPKKRKSAKKKKELEKTLKNAPNTQDECSNLERELESITESTTDSVLTTVTQDLPAPEQLERFKPIFIQELQGTIKEVEGLKLTVIQQLQAIEKVTAVLHKLVDDYNNFQLTGGQ